MRSEKLQGVILKRSNFGEADKIVTIFTRERGKVRAVAKGIRRIKSRRAPHLELFNQVEILLHHGKTFDIITEAKILTDYHELKRDLRLSGYLFYVSEVIDKILPEHQQQEGVYISFLRILGNLCAVANLEGQVKQFVVQLLWDLGYLPNGQYPKIGVTNFVENIVEKRIRSKKFLEEI